MLAKLDALAEKPVWKGPLVAYLFASTFLWTVATVAHHEHGIAYMPALGVPIYVVFSVVVSAIREILYTPAYFATLAGILLAVSRLRPGNRVSFRQLFSATVHVGYVLLVGHALRVALAALGVELVGSAAVLLPGPDAMFGPVDMQRYADRPGVVPPEVSLVLSGSPADVPSTGMFDTAFHALLGVAYCRLRGHRLLVGAAWGAGLSLLVDLLWWLYAGSA